MLIALDVEHVREVVLHIHVKSIATEGQWFIHQYLQKVSEIVTPVKANPSYFVIKDASTSSKLLREIEWVDSSGFQLLEVNSGILQQKYGVLCFLVCVNIKVKVKLPCGYRCWHLSIFICECDTNLNDLQDVYIGLYTMILPVLLYKYTEDYQDCHQIINDVFYLPHQLLVKCLQPLLLEILYPKHEEKLAWIVV